MDNQGTPINGRAKRPRKLRTAAGRVALSFEERLVWPAGDALRWLGGTVRRAAEWLAWAVRRGLVWPLQDRVGTLGAVAAVLAVLIIGAGVAATLLSSSGDPDSTPAAAEVAVAPAPAPEPAPAPVETAPEPTLQGAAPVFKPAKQSSPSSSSKVQPAEKVESAPAEQSSDPATATIGSGPGASTSAAQSSSAPVDGRPAGAEAIAVARDFAGAFVLYETGGEEAAVRDAFAATATKELAKSLLRRPPRLPANVKVPKAKVVNVVAAPSHGKIYPVSVSLLRIGVTSELRLEMEQLKNDRWRVINVLG